MSETNNLGEVKIHEGATKDDTVNNIQQTLAAKLRSEPVDWFTEDSEISVSFKMEKTPIPPRT